MSKLDFPGQQKGEKVLFVFRRHIISIWKGFFALLALAALGSTPFLIWRSNSNLLWGSVIGLGFGLIVFFYHWIGWYFSVYIVTNERIRQVSQKSLFGRSVIDINLVKIQNHSYHIPGFFGEIFGFGTIVLQTAVGNMIMDNIAKCEQIYGELSNTLHKAGVNTADNLEEGDE